MSYLALAPAVAPVLIQRMRDAVPGSEWLAPGQPRTYEDGEVPSGAPPGYFLLGSVREDPGLYYGLAGAEGEYTVHAWGAHKRAAIALAGWFMALFHEVTLTVQGHRIEIAQVRLAGVYPGPGTTNERQAELILTLRAVGPA